VIAVSARAPAKLNLGLRVLGRRADGFHALDSLFVRLDLADDVALRADGAADGLVRRAAGDPWLDPRPLGIGPDNLVLRALAAYRAAAGTAGVAVPPVAAELTKRIPWGAGLAGGSADAAATLRAAAALWPAPVDLPELAAALGSDVPFCLADLPAARVGGRGETIVPVDLPPLALVLVYPDAEVPTGPAFGWWAAEPVDVAPPDEAALRAGRRPLLANALEAPVARRVPAVAEALAALRALAIGPVAMSGSGSTCFAVAADPEAAATAVAELRARRPDWWVRAARSD
jgi:4-diphosphocytidyl-2-C-methyl-D-erythritol kinase